MARYAYDRLSALDNSFLMFEDGCSHMHVASTATFDAGPLATPDGGLDIERIREFIAGRLHRIPRYRQKLAWVPVENQPVWVDDERFNLAYHVRHTSLPKPGDDRQLKRLSARIASQQLDRGKPLWEVWFVEGLEGNRFAMISKVHHCMVDGVSGVDLLEVLLDVRPDAPREEAPLYIPRGVPSAYELLRDEILDRVTAPLQVLGRVLRDPRGVVEDVVESVKALGETVFEGMKLPSETPVNQEIGPYRRFDWVTFDVEQVKEVKNALGGSLNDVVLATVAGAMRRFLARRRVDPGALTFRVMVPVSVRSTSERGTLGNKVAAWMADLPIGEPDATRRYARVCETTSRLKHSKQAMGAEILTRVTDWTPSTLLALGARLAHRGLPFNLVVTNVPGPQVPLYLLGARMQEIYPLVPLFARLGLGIALFSYAGRLHWGFNADWDVVPDLHDVVRVLEESFAELHAAALAARGGQRPGERRAVMRDPVPLQVARGPA
ncbi:wax ester/triacylglycerol synthase family O-acyltransferase [Candidatus Binatia bacterium]|nr:wax ester/triacylglycerol synthase family O-acyltransferase [Candidatus Binatia bacterium]